VVEVTTDLDLLVTFGVSLEGVCHELVSKFHYKLISNLEGAICEQTFLEKSFLQSGCVNVISLVEVRLVTGHKNEYCVLIVHYSDDDLKTRKK
jgi:hypothetical protein